MSRSIQNGSHAAQPPTNNQHSWWTSDWAPMQKFLSISTGWACKLGAERAKTCMQRVRVPTELPFCVPRFDGWAWLHVMESLIFACNVKRGKSEVAKPHGPKGKQNNKDKDESSCRPRCSWMVKKKIEERERGIQPETGGVTLCRQFERVLPKQALTPY